MFERVSTVKDYGMPEESPKARNPYSELTEGIAKELSQINAKDVALILSDVKKILTQRYFSRRDEIAKEMEFIKQELEYINQ